MTKKECFVCGSVKKIRNHYVIPKIWNSQLFSEFENLIIPLCIRCHECCPPFVIESKNHKLSYEVTRALNNKFPFLYFEIKEHYCRDSECPLHNKLYIGISKRIDKK